MSSADAIETFRRLHESGCFVIPNAWDVGSAKQLAGLGFKALATTSSGAAWAHGRPDGGLTCDEMLAHIADVVAATDLPVNADFMNGYADDPDEVGVNVTRCVETGVAGLSIEDTRPDGSLYDTDLAVERVRAARAAIDASGREVLLTTRCEVFLTTSEDPLSVARERLTAFAAVGGEAFFAPGVVEPEHIEAIVAAVAPAPVNVLVGPKHGTVADLAGMGVRRISVGGGLARAAWGGFLRGARDLAENGSFGWLADAEPGGELNRFFAGQ
ncbi:MAG: isocitrate lyase/phosphoenolpyruvate mutase family protein [Actinomycetota bacterium]